MQVDSNTQELRSMYHDGTVDLSAVIETTPLEDRQAALREIAQGYTVIPKVESLYSKHRAAERAKLEAEVALPCAATPITEIQVRNPVEWLGYAKAARMAGEEISVWEDPRTRSFGFTVGDKSYRLDLTHWVTSLKSHQKESFELQALVVELVRELVPDSGYTTFREVSAQMATTEGRHYILTGKRLDFYHNDRDEYDSGPTSLQEVWMQEAEAEKPVDMGVLQLERPEVS